MVSVVKFGGTSIKNVGRIQHVADVISKINDKCLVVASAMGDTTDHLYGLAKQCAIHPDKRELDLLLATGEQVSIALLALTLRERGINARSFTGQQIGIITDNNHSCARILDICPDKINEAFAEYDVIIVAGFQGISFEGQITTLGRGGSDTTAVALAAACGAAHCDIYTDVDGIFTCDPNRFTEAQLIPEISYSEVLELARSGAQIIHPRAVETAQDHGVQVRVRNTFNPENAGTLIKEETNVERICKATSVAVDGCQAHICFTGVQESKLFLSGLSEAFSRADILIDVVSQGTISGEGSKNYDVSIKYSDHDSLARALAQIEKEFSIAGLVVDKEVTRVSVVGAGLSADPAAIARLVSVLEDNEISPRLLSFTDLRISCLVLTASAKRAVESLHAEFKLGKTTGRKLALTA